jgi:membrane-associated protease RseP (regulator of RpoE activity)
MIHETPAGRVVTLVLSRDGQPVTIKVQLADRRGEFHMNMNMKEGDWSKNYHVEIPQIPSIPPIPNIDFEVPNIQMVAVYSSARSGLMVENLTPQLKEFFGTRNGNGVLVRSVEKGSRADKAGLRAGDVITRVGDQPVHDTSDFTHALHSRSAGSVSVGVIRDKKEQTLTLTLPERRESGATIEESRDEPALDAEVRTELSEVQNEVAKLGPQMELAREEVRKASEEMRKSMCDQQKKMRKQAEKLKEQLGPKVQEELQKSQEKLRQEVEQLRHSMLVDWLDI